MIICTGKRFHLDNLQFSGQNNQIRITLEEADTSPTTMSISVASRIYLN